MAREELEIEISPSGKVTARTIGIKGPRCLDLADFLARIVGREESRQLTSEYYEASGASAGTRRREAALVSGPCSAATASLRTSRGSSPAVGAGPACNWPRWRSTFTPRARPGGQSWRHVSPDVLGDCDSRLAAAMVSDHAVLEPFGSRGRFSQFAYPVAIRLADARGASADDRSRLGATVRRPADCGRWMFGCYLGLLLSGLLFLGNGLGWLLLGLAISLHAASVLDIVAASVHDFRQRLIYSGVAMSLCLHRRCIIRRATAAAWPPRNNSTWRRLRLRRGTWCWQFRPPTSGPIRSRAMWFITFCLRKTGGCKGGQDGATYRLQGDRIDRIFAKARPEGNLQQGKLLIDGQPSPWLPLGSPQLPATALDITVPENSYLDFPQYRTRCLRPSG